MGRMNKFNSQVLDMTHKSRLHGYLKGFKNHHHTGILADGH